MHYSHRTFTICTLLLSLAALSSCSLSSGLTLPAVDTEKERRFRAGNLVPDSGFEANPQVSWSGSGCEVTESAAHTGAHALELRGGESGDANCLSPAIEVGPGHYDLSLWLKTSIEHTASEQRYRDAIQFRLHLFDGDGEKIDQTVSFRGREIEAGELGSAFGEALFGEQIQLDQFSRIALRPHYYRFDWGWLPDGAHTARLEIVLNAPGAIWIDDINLNYSKWNFTLRERVELLGLREGEQVLYPTPAEMRGGGESFAISQKTLCPVGDADGEILESITWKRLVKKLSTHGIHSAASCSGVKNAYRLVMRVEADKGAEEYTLQIQKSHGEILAGSRQALRFALNTFRQLISSDGTKSYIAGAAIADKPYFALRSASAKDVRRSFPHARTAAQWLDENRLNTLFIELNTISGAWWEPNTVSLELAEKLSESAERIAFGVLINPYIHNADVDVERELVLSDPETVNDIYRIISPYLALGATQIILRADDFVPAKKDMARFAYYLDSAEDRKVYGSLAAAHVDLITKLKERMMAEYPAAQLLFVPPFYTNFFVDESSGLGAEYLSELGAGLSDELPIMWAGQAVRALIINEFQQKRLASLLDDHPVVLWDNTPYARRHRKFWGTHPERARFASFLEPYSVEMMPEYMQPGAFLNVSTSEMNRIQLTTAGAYLWNPLRYHPEKMLHAYLIERFSWEGAKALLAVDEAYWLLRSAKLRDNAVQVKRQQRRLHYWLYRFEESAGSEGSKLLTELRTRVTKAISLR